MLSYFFPFHYRAIKNGLLDTYMLKSLDGLMEGDVADTMVVKRPDGKLVLSLPGVFADMMVIQSLSYFDGICYRIILFFSLQSNIQWFVRHVHADISGQLIVRRCFSYNGCQIFFNLTIYDFISFFFITEQ